MGDKRTSLNLIARGEQVLTPDEIRAHLRIDSASEDTYIKALAASAQAMLEGPSGILGRALLTQQWRYDLASFWDCGAGRQGEIQLPLPPLKTVDAVEYLDTEGAVQTVSASDYRIVNGGGLPASIMPAVNASWPSAVLRAPDAVRVTFTAGYDDADALNADRPGIRQAMLLIVEHWYENRGAIVSKGGADELPLGVHALLSPHRVRWF